MTTVPLSPTARARGLARCDIDEPVDVLVVGGGVVGAGVALDAASRGLSVMLVEAGDWASGTSSRSSKLVHGGLRYLEMLDFGLVAEALHERGLMMQRLAPHLVRPVQFLYPLRHRGWERLYVGAGIGLYDAMARRGRASSGVPLHRHLSRRSARRVAPALKASALVGAVQYWDAVVDDARHTLTVVRTAAQLGAVCLSGVRVAAFVLDDDRVVGAELHDADGSVRTVRARHTVTATGVWTEEVERLAQVEPDVRVRSSKGVHILVPRDRIESSSAIIVRARSSVLLVVPWGDQWLIGTTDTEWKLGPASPAANSRDVDYLLATVNEVLERPLIRDDVQAVYAGLRPLLAGGSDETSKLSREHVVSSPRRGLTAVAGGKYTTYRVMAADAMDAAAADLARTGTPVPPSVTDCTPLLGAEGFAAARNVLLRNAAEHGVTREQMEHLLHRYGAVTTELLDLVRDRPELARPIPGATTYLQAEVVYGVTHEGARRLEDVLVRRLRLSVETTDGALAAAPFVAALMAPVLGWSTADEQAEVRMWSDAVASERRARELPDDSTTDPGPRPVLGSR